MSALGSIRWIALALLGLAVAAVVSVAASQLVSQRIGLAAEPVSAGRELVPHEHRGKAGHRNGGGDASRSVPTSTTTTTVPSTTTPAPSTTTPSTAPTTTAPPSPTPSNPPGGGTDGEGPDD